MSNYFAHESAVIDAGAVIGAETKIWHFSHIMGQSDIGSDCVLGQNVHIGSNVSIGDRVKIQNNVSLYDGIMCENDVFIGPSAVFTNVINPRSWIERKSEFTKTLIRKGATVGANATILCGIEIGEYSFIGAGAVVTESTLPYQLIVGNPGKSKGWMSQHGGKLKFESNDMATCPISKWTYELINGHQVQLKNKL